MPEQRPFEQPVETPLDAASIEAQLAATEHARAFISDQAPHLGRLFGTDLQISIGTDKWSTDMTNGHVTVDPSFFTEKGYTSDMSVYATLHEVVAHLREVQTEPELTAQALQFRGQGKAEQIFHNILADIAGNHRIHAALPRMGEVAEELYDTKLFPSNNSETGLPIDYANTRAYPRHLQFLYKIMRQEMIADSQTVVQPEVDAAIDSLRNYEGQGDVIQLSTEAPKRRTDQLSAADRFKTWNKIIYPEYWKLIELDKQDPAAGADAAPNPGEGSAEHQPGEPQKGHGQFDAAYDDYFQQRHPEPLSEEEQEKVAAAAQQKAHEQSHPIDPQAAHDQQLREQTGYGLNEHLEYKSNIDRNLKAISRMRDIYRSVIGERMAYKRGLSRTAYSEGAMLDPNRLAQTIVDIKSGVREPEAYLQYEQRQGEIMAVGKTDYIFVFDCSSSMFNGPEGKKPADAAAQSAIILMEGLSAMQRDIEATEAADDTDLELDIQTALYTFGSQAECIKPLSKNLSDKNRLDIVHKVKTIQGTTADYLALQEIAEIPRAADRQRFVIVATDGRSDNDAASRAAQAKLRTQGVSVYGIGINSDEATALYAPHARRIDSASELPDALQTFIEGTFK
jgi:hypothetical protein